MRFYVKLRVLFLRFFDVNDYKKHLEHKVPCSPVSEGWRTRGGGTSGPNPPLLASLMVLNLSGCIKISMNSVFGMIFGF